MKAKRTLASPMNSMRLGVCNRKESVEHDDSGSESDSDSDDEEENDEERPTTTAILSIENRKTKQQEIT